MSEESVNFFNEPDQCRTTALEVEDRTFWVPRDTLAVYSPVFKALLYGDFVEANKDVIRLPGQKAIDIQELLFCLIPTPRIKAIDDSNVDMLLGFADQYQIEELRNRAESFLVTKLAKCAKSDAVLLYILRIASNHKMRSLLVPCLKRCSEEFDVRELEMSFGGLRIEVIAALMYRKSAASGQPNCQYNVTDQPCRNGGHGGGGGGGDRKVYNCHYCTRQYCEFCQGRTMSREYQYQLGSCQNKVSETEIDEVVSSLLDRM